MTGRRSDRSDDGFTMVELLVVVLLMSFVGAMMIGFLDNTTNITAKVDDHVEAERDAIVALRRLSQDVRSANPILVTTTAPVGLPKCPSAYAALTYGNCLELIVSKNLDLSGATVCDVDVRRRVALPFRRVVFRLEGSNVLEDRYEHTTSCTSPSSTSLARPVLSEVSNGATPLFTFLNGAGSPIALNQPITTVASVRINVTIAYRAGSAPLHLSSVASLRNYRT